MCQTGVLRVTTRYARRTKSQSRDFRRLTQQSVVELSKALCPTSLEHTLAVTPTRTVTGFSAFSWGVWESCKLICWVRLKVTRRVQLLRQPSNWPARASGSRWRRQVPASLAPPKPASRSCDRQNRKPVQSMGVSVLVIGFVLWHGWCRTLARPMRARSVYSSLRMIQKWSCAAHGALNQAASRDGQIVFLFQAVRRCRALPEQRCLQVP